MLLITEGELKAACSAKNGLPCIGLGGVWMFKAAAQGKSFLDQLEQIVWKDRPVFIVYDSDAATNPDVMKAENALARALLDRGARVFICRIPALENKHENSD
jgi:putative DNA primase/helicase